MPEHKQKSTPAPSPTDQLSRSLRDLRISVTDKCNLRCDYCLPEAVFGPDFRFLPKNQLLSFEEIVRIVGVFAELGVEKIRLTGGEPLLRRELPKLIGQLRKHHPKIDLALTTNGHHLSRDAASLRAHGLDRVNVSLDALDPAVAQQLAGKNADPERTWQNILCARDQGLHPKVNMVVQKGVNESQILPLAERCRTEAIPLRFIEFMDVGTRNQWQLDKVVTGKQIHAALDRAFGLLPEKPNYPGEVARRFRYRDGGGEVGFINSISEPFCAGCTRARISAEGMLYTCLFASTGKDLRAWLRTGAIDDAELSHRLRTLWNLRDDRYSETRHQHIPGTVTAKAEMWRLGG